MLNILVNASGWNDCSTSPIARLSYLFCTFHFPPCRHSSSGLLSPQAHLGKKITVIAGGEATGWSRWHSDRSQMLITLSLLRTPSTYGDTHSRAAEGPRKEGWHVGAEVGVKVWVLCQPNIPSLLAHAQSEELWKRLHVCGNISWSYGWCTVCLPLSLLQLFKALVGAQMVKSSDMLYFNICALLCLLMTAKSYDQLRPSLAFFIEDLSKPQHDFLTQALSYTHTHR